MHFIGGNADFDLAGGWKVSDKFLFFGGNMDTNALFSGPNPAALSAELYDPTTGSGYALPPGSATAVYADNGQPVTGDPSVIQQGQWFIHKRLFSINNDLRVSKQIFEGNTATVGLYVAHYTDHDKWSLGNNRLMTNTPNARPITVSYVDPTTGRTLQRLDPQGFDFNGGFNIIEDGSATHVAGYFSDSQRWGSWLFDASVRAEHVDLSNTVCNLSSVNLDGNPDTIYDNKAQVCNGTSATTDYKPTRVPWTVGANYEITDHMSVYARVNKGYHYLDFDNGVRGSTTGHTPPEQSVENQEVGFKYQSSLVFADISVYHKSFKGLQYTPTNGLGSPLLQANGQQVPPLIYGSDSKGVNFNVVVSPLSHFKIGLVGNYMDGIYTGYFACISYVNPVTGNGCATIDGRQLQRQPKFRIAVQPSYTIPFGWGDVTTFLTYSHVGQHTQDQAGLQLLGTYDVLDFGVVGNYGDNWELRVQGTNLTNELGLTESNSRIFGPAAGAGGVILARPLEGREVNVTLRYKF